MMLQEAVRATPDTYLTGSLPPCGGQAGHLGQCPDDVPGSPAPGTPTKKSRSPHVSRGHHASSRRVQTTTPGGNRQPSSSASLLRVGYQSRDALLVWLPASGERVVDTVPQHYGSDVTMIGTLSLQGLDTVLIVDRATDGDVFQA
jgi:hypothetical protein